MEVAMRPADSTKLYNPFLVVSDFSPAGDQPKAIEELATALNEGHRDIVLLGATGTGKSATTAWMIEKVQRPTLVLAPNKTLAAQLAAELRALLPNNAVEYFVSYYDYYQPEAYVPSSDTFIEKDSSVNAEIERLRYSATHSLLTRRDVVVVATVSCIYGIGAPESYIKQATRLAVGDVIERDQFLRKLVLAQFKRNDTAPSRGEFRVRGDVVDVYPAHEVYPIRIEFFEDVVEKISVLHPINKNVIRTQPEAVFFPASFYAMDKISLDSACNAIEAELSIRVKELKNAGKLLEAQRILMRTEADLEAIRSLGFCSGIENYSRHLDGRSAGSAPSCLLDYFPEDFVVVIDESHVTVPQLGAMYSGDRSRKNTLVEFGFRLPSALDNRPLQFNEFLERTGQTVYLSATPGSYEMERAGKVVEQVIRPTGLIDPKIIIKPSEGQIDHLLGLINQRVSKDERVLVTTLTKKMAEELTKYLLERKIKVTYLHSDIDTVERIEILRKLRAGKLDVVVGINLLREGLDLPEVSLVAILDADKEGFLRSTRSLIQTIGRAARNVSGEVYMYADKVTDSMKAAIAETDRRRAIQNEYNELNGIDPTPIRKAIADLSDYMGDLDSDESDEIIGALHSEFESDPAKLIAELSLRMNAAAQDLQFEIAARLRDEIKELKKEARARAEFEKPR
jgi:excinuclease ABC subunit B